MRSILCLCVALFALSATTARAQLLLTFDAPVQTAQPGDTITIDGTLFNAGNADVALGGDTYSLGSSYLTLDDTPYITTAPLSLSSMQSWHGELFTVSVDPNVQSFVAVNTFTVTDPNFQDLATSTFILAVPEPGNVIVFLSLLTATGTLLRRSRTARLCR